MANALATLLVFLAAWSAAAWTVVAAVAVVERRDRRRTERPAGLEQFAAYLAPCPSCGAPAQRACTTTNGEVATAFHPVRAAAAFGVVVQDEFGRW